MFVYLNPPRAFWQIPNTEIGLSRSKPVRDITEVEYKSLNQQQALILEKALKLGVLTKVSETVAKEKALTDNDILLLSAPEMQRRYVSKYVLGKDLGNLRRLFAAEKAKSEPRQEVLFLLKSAADRVLIDNPEEKFYQEIEVIEDEVLPAAPQAEEKPKKAKSRTRTAKAAEANQ